VFVGYFFVILVGIQIRRMHAARQSCTACALQALLNSHMHRNWDAMNVYFWFCSGMAHD